MDFVWVLEVLPSLPFKGDRRSWMYQAAWQTGVQTTASQTNKQTTFLLLQHFFLWGLCCSTQRWRYKLLDEVSGQTGFSFQLDARRRKIAGSQHVGFCCKIISLPAAFSSDSRTGVSEGNFSNYTIVPTYRRKRDGIEEKQELNQQDSQAY